MAAVFILSSGFQNAEFQVYTPAPENSYVRDGLLYLKAVNIKILLNLVFCD